MEEGRRVLTAFTDEGYEAYFVGGCVRDRLMGITPQDVDIVTSAAPEEIEAVAEKHHWRVLKVGAAFGVMMVIVGHHAYEVASYRTETYGADSHRPADVRLVQSLAEDLARRDFTINAMAMGKDGRVIDYFGGRQDLARKILRTVGDPKRRFAEDGLRMFRAARFVAQLGFNLSQDALAAIPESSYRVRGLSVERVKGEVEAILLADQAAAGLRILMNTGLLGESCRSKDQGKSERVHILPELAHLKGLGQNMNYHTLDAWEHTLAAVAAAPKDPAIRWAALLHDLGKGLSDVRSYKADGTPIDHEHHIRGAELAYGMLHRLKVSPEVIRQTVWMVRHHMMFPPPDLGEVMRWLRRLVKESRNGEEFRERIRKLLLLNRADRVAGHKTPDLDGWEEVNSLVEEMLDSLPFYPAELNIGGRDIAAVVGTGPQVKKFQQALLERIHSGQLSPKRESLEEALRKKARRLKEESGGLHEGPE